MPAVTVDNTPTLLRLPKVSSESSVSRPVELPADQVAPAQLRLKGGFMSKLQIIIGSTRPSPGRRQGRSLGDRPRGVPPCI